MFAQPRWSDEESQDRIRLADWVELNLVTEEETVMAVEAVAAELGMMPPDDADDAERRLPVDEERRPEGAVGGEYWTASEERAADAFGELAQRARWLGRGYPVTVADETAAVRGDAAGRSVYRFLTLLRARHLYRGALGDDGDVAGLLFEELVKHALGAYAGAGPAERVRFGVAGGTRGDGLPLQLADAVRELARRVNEPVGDVPVDREGDFRADVMAWKGFGDGLGGQLTLIGQATISEGDWETKEPANRWVDRRPNDGRLIDWRARPVTAVAFAETLSLTPRARREGTRPSCIPFDRLRLASVLHEHPLPVDLMERIVRWGDGLIATIPR